MKTVSWNRQCLHGRWSSSPPKELLSLWHVPSFPERAVTVLYLPYGHHAWAQLDVVPLDMLCQALRKLLGASPWRDKYRTSRHRVLQAPSLQGHHTQISTCGCCTSAARRSRGWINGQMTASFYPVKALARLMCRVTDHHECKFTLIRNSSE